MALRQVNFGSNYNNLGISVDIEDRRRQRRYKIGLHGNIVSSTATIPVFATDISVNGLRVESTDLVIPETVVVVSLFLKEETLLTGQVLWSLESERMGQRFYQIGIEVHAIILREMEAIGFLQKEALVQEILSRAKQTNVA